MEREDIFNNDLLQKLIQQNKIDLLLISSRHNVRYITGGYFFPLFVWDTNTHETQYLPFIGIPAGNTDKSFFIGRPWEKSTTADAGLWIKDCTETFSLGIEPAVEEAVSQIKSRGLDSARIGIEMPVLPAEAYVRMKKELPQAEFINITPMMDSLRAVKTEREIDIIRKGTLLQLEAIDSALLTAKPGMTTLETADLVAEGYRERNLHFLYALVCAGPSYYRAASPNQRFKTDCIMHIDSGALTKGYVVETCRTGALGPPTAEADTMFGLCAELEEHMLPYLQPGAAAAEIQKEADAFISKKDIAHTGEFIAHGIGMIHHEKPVINLNSKDKLEERMVLSIEMEYRSKTTGHVKVEDMLVIRPGESEILSPGGDEWKISNQ